MQVVFDDFNERKEEVNKYFDFIKKLEEDYRILKSTNEGDPVYNIDEDQLKMFRANGFLILYNLVESTINKCIISIFDEISAKEIDSKKLNFLDVTEKIKKYWLKNKYKHDPDIKTETIHNRFYLICQEITNNISFQIIGERLGYGGSLQAKRMRAIASDLGIPLDEPHYRENLHGEALVKIKNFRNQLAHGEKSFSSIGRDVTYIGDGLDGRTGLGLIHFKDYTIEHLTSFMNNINTFIINEGYLYGQSATV